MNKKELLIKLIEIGYNIEAIDYNGKFEGYKGFEKDTRQNQLDIENEKANKIIEELNKLDIDPFNYNGEDFEYTDFGGESLIEELEYASQFIGLTYEGEEND